MMPSEPPVRVREKRDKKLTVGRKERMGKGDRRDKREGNESK